MGRTDWTYVNLPKLLVKRLENHIQNQREKIGYCNKTELLRKIITDYLDEQETLYNNIESIPEFISKMSDRDHIVITHDNESELLEILNAFFERGKRDNTVCVLAILKNEEDKISQLIKKCDVNVDLMLNEQDAIIVFVDDCINGKFDITPFKNDMELIQENSKRNNKNGITVLATISDALAKQQRFSDVLLDEKFAHRMANESELPLSIICLYSMIPNKLIRELEDLHDIIIKKTVTQSGLT